MRQSDPMTFTKAVISEAGIDALKTAVKALRIAAKDVSAHLEDDRKPREVKIWENLAIQIEQQVITFTANH